MAPGGSPSPLGYPERFQAAAQYIQTRHAGTKQLKEDTQLLLYALYNQAVKGPCNQPKPSSWGAGGAHDVLKWQSWKGLGDMNSAEAMRLYVRTVEEEEPNWYTSSQMVNGDTPSSGAEAQPPRSATELATSSSWTSVPISATERGPLPRYEHAAAMLGHNLIVVGGNYTGRYMNDVWKLNVNTLAWTQVQTKPFAGPSSPAAGEDADKKQQVALKPIAGHTATPWNDTLVIMGGHAKAADASPSLTVQVMDLAGEVAKLAPHGTAPCSRGSHTACLVGRRIYVFGGEDPKRRPLGDLWHLDLDSLTWCQPEVAGKAPSARSAHAAAGYQNRFLLVFGGGSAATCLSDIHVLDTHAIPMQWSQLKVTGPKITPRAGHTGVVVGSVWYIVGGGNNKTGCTDMLALDLSQLEVGVVSWSSAAAIPTRHPLSSEGIALAAVGPSTVDSPESVLISFGGYNGKYLNALNVIRVPGKATSTAAVNGTPAGKQVAGKTAAPAVAAPAAVAPAAPPPPSDAELLAETRVKLEAAQRDAEAALKEAAAAKENAGHELALLRKQLNTAHAAAADSQKDLEVAKVNLSREREKVMKLEAEVAELRKKLESATEAQKDLEALRKAVKENEAKKSSGGIWTYISGQS